MFIVDGLVVMSFGSQEFWDKWYRNRVSGEDQQNLKDEVEWYVNWRDLYLGLIRQVPTIFDKKTNLTILVVGCGNSSFAEEMLSFETNDNQSFSKQKIFSIDYSEPVIQFMKQKFPSNANQYIVCDVCNMSKQFPNDDLFDLIIDKGTLDSILCNEKSGEMVSSMMSEIKRVSKRNGKLIVVSDGEVHERNHYFRTLVRNVNDDILHFKIDSTQNEKTRGFAQDEKYNCYVITINK